MTGESLPARRLTTHVPVLVAADSTAAHEFLVGFGLERLRAPRAASASTAPACIPSRSVSTAPKSTHSTFVTWMVVVDPQRGELVRNRCASPGSGSSEPVRSSCPTGSSTVDARRRCSPGGRLDHIATLLARAGSFPLTLGIGPETLADLERRGADARRARARRSTRSQRQPRALRPSCLPEPYVPIAGPTIEAEGLGSHLPEEYVAGSNAVDERDRPDPRSAHRVRRSGRRRATIDRLTQMQVGRFVVRDTSLVPVAGAAHARRNRSC